MTTTTEWRVVSEWPDERFDVYYEAKSQTDAGSIVLELQEVWPGGTHYIQSREVTPWETPQPRTDGCPTCGQDPIAVKGYKTPQGISLVCPTGHEWSASITLRPGPESAT